MIEYYRQWLYIVTIMDKTLHTDTDINNLPTLKHKRIWRAPLYAILFLLALAIVGMAVLSLLSLPAQSNPTAAVTLIGLLLVSLTLLISLYFLLNKHVYTPLSNLSEWARAIRRDTPPQPFETQLPNEFGHLMKDLNYLGDKVRLLSHDMQSQVEEKTRHIAQKTHSLEIIYDVAASINVSRDLDDLLTRFLHTLKDVVNARAAVVRLITPDGQMRLVASTGLADEVVAREQLLPADTCLCGSAYDKGVVQYQYDIKQCDKIIGYTFFDSEEKVGMLAVPLQYRDQTLGVYNLFVEQTIMAECEQMNDLLTSIGRHLGMAIDKARLDDETNRLSIMEERTRMAHELHDSLAQTLASLRFQVRVLDENLRLGEEPAVWHELEKIENNLDEAYAELRELITHFRAPIDKRGLVPAVKHLANRFRNQTGIHIFLQQEWNIVQLSPSIEVEVLRIIQEALNNIRKHSQAHTVRVILRSNPQGECSILIEDDGVGLTKKQVDDQQDHYGLQIMKERSKRINAKLRIESEPGEGTQITLMFNTQTAPAPTTNDSKVYVELPTKSASL